MTQAQATRSSRLRRRPLRPLAVLPVFLAAAVAACERRADREATDGAGGSAVEIPGGLPEPAFAPADAAEVPPPSRSPVPVTEPPPTLAPAADTVLPATREELAALSAVLDVPVAGVRRSQLHDTFTDARGDRVHEALDIAAPRGTPVLSATDGRVLRLFDSRPGGLMVYATDASERFILLYGHLDGYAPGLTDGMPLTRGQVIGYVGTTGNAPADAPHLHFGILRGRPAASWSTGIAVNPYPLLVRDTSSP